MNIQAYYNSPEVREVLRRHNITASGLEAIRQGYAAKGDLFMYDYLKAIAPKSSVLNGNYGDPGEMGPPTFQQWTEQTTSKGKGWDWWSTLLTTAGETGKTIAGLKADILGNGTGPAATTDTPAEQKPASNIIIYVVAGIVLLAVGILIYKQSKQ